MEEKFNTPQNFIKSIIEEDFKKGKVNKIITRFPPEPNGYLHIGHAKSICLNFGLAEDFAGHCNLRFDDTNPSKEELEYVKSIIEDVKWLGFDWKDRIYYASDYFEQLYQWAEDLIKKGLAYVCELTPEEIKEYRGTLTEPGKESQWRNRPIEENLDLFRRMRAGEFPDGSKTLRSKIDMSSGNINMRDPVMYRIKHEQHHRTGNKWCIYPMYDYAHGQSDSIEGVTHSICTIEYEDHRPLYDWYLDAIGIYHPQQIEFARLNLSHTVLSKRKLLVLVNKGFVSGWNDPRMPTIAGIRRRGYTPKSIRNFCERIGVGKKESLVDIALLEFCIREDLNKIAQRVMAVLNPVKVTIINYPEDKIEYLDAINNPEDPQAGTRKIPFSREIFIEKDDFMEHPVKDFYRLAPNREVRLRYAYFIKCIDFKKDNEGNISEIICTYDPATRGGDAPDKRKVKATLHWVSVRECFEAEVRLYETLFTKENPDDTEEGKDFTDYINPNSLKVIKDAKLEPSLKNAQKDDKFQFERLGYFCVDSVDSKENAPVFNRTVTLKDEWAKIKNKVIGQTNK